MTAVDVSRAQTVLRDAYARVLDDGFQAMLLDMEANAPRDTGLMTQSIELSEADGETQIERTIRAPQEYSSYQDSGTGVYAGEGRIYPVTAKALRFVAKDGTVVFVKSVAGTPRTGWWTDTVAKLGDYLRSAMP